MSFTAIETEINIHSGARWSKALSNENSVELSFDELADEFIERAPQITKRAIVLHPFVLENQMAIPVVDRPNAKHSESGKAIGGKSTRVTPMAQLRLVPLFKEVLSQEMWEANSLLMLFHFHSVMKPWVSRDKTISKNTNYSKYPEETWNGWNGQGMEGINGWIHSWMEEVVEDGRNGRTNGMEWNGTKMKDMKMEERSIIYSAGGRQ